MKTCFCFFLATLLLTSSVAVRDVTLKDGSGRCLSVMDPTGCELTTCRQRCLQQKNGNGVCLASSKEGYQCVCYINC